VNDGVQYFAEVANGRILLRKDLDPKKVLIMVDAYTYYYMSASEKKYISIRQSTRLFYVDRPSLKTRDDGADVVYDFREGPQSIDYYNEHSLKIQKDKYRIVE
jgi:hypothetical protein